MGKKRARIRNIGQEILDGIREIKAGRVGRIIYRPSADELTATLEAMNAKYGPPSDSAKAWATRVLGTDQIEGPARTPAMKTKTTKKKPMKRPSYRQAVAWIGENDGLGDSDAVDPEAVNGYMTVGFVADLFGVEQAKVAADVVAYRLKKDGGS